MASMAFTPGCCCTDCTIFEDEFTRANAAGLGDSWTDADWDIDTNQATTDTDDAFAIANEAGPDANGVVTVTFLADDFADEFKLILSWEDADNYVFALFTIAADANSCGTIEIFERVATVETQIGDTLSIDDFQPATTYYLAFCRNGSELQAIRSIDADFTDVQSLVVNDAPAGVTGLQAGMASGTITALLTIDDFLYTVRHEDCRPCGPPCILIEDDFDRSDAADLGCQWTKEDGTSEIASDMLKMTENPTVVATVAETPTQTQLVNVNVTLDAGDIARIIVLYTDIDNYLFAQVTFNTTSTLKLFSRIASVETELGTVSFGSLVSGFAIKVCWMGNTLTAQIGSVAITLSRIVAAPPAGKRAGLSATTMTTAVLFDNFELLRHDQIGGTEGCDECFAECVCCDTGYQPHIEYIVDLGGPSLGNSDCGNCTGIAGEFTVEKVDNTACFWRYQDCVWCDFLPYAGGGCGNENHALEVQLRNKCTVIGTSHWEVTVVLYNAGLACAVDPSCTFERTAVYESAASSDADRCQDMPVTLTRISDNFSQVFAGPKQVCTGNLPATITLRR